MLVETILTAIITAILTSTIMFRWFGVRYIKMLDKHLDESTEAWKKLLLDVVEKLRETHGTK